MSLRPPGLPTALAPDPYTCAQLFPTVAPVLPPPRPPTYQPIPPWQTQPPPTLSTDQSRPPHSLPNLCPTAPSHPSQPGGKINVAGNKAPSHVHGALWRGQLGGRGTGCGWEREPPRVSTGLGHLGSIQCLEGSVAWGFRAEGLGTWVPGFSPCSRSWIWDQSETPYLAYGRDEAPSSCRWPQKVYFSSSWARSWLWALAGPPTGLACNRHRTAKAAGSGAQTHCALSCHTPEG